MGWKLLLFILNTRKYEKVEKVFALQAQRIVVGEYMSIWMSFKVYMLITENMMSVNTERALIVSFNCLYLVKK